MQELADRVTILEEGHRHILKVQSSILKNQEEIFSRLAALEKCEQGYQMSPFRMSTFGYTQAKASFDDGGAAEDFSFNSLDENNNMLPPPYIPPPPVQHLPPPRQPHRTSV